MTAVVDELPSLPPPTVPPGLPASPRPPWYERSIDLAALPTAILCARLFVASTLQRWGARFMEADAEVLAVEGSMFEVTVRCEYRVRPANAVMRFACVSKPDEYSELLRDPTVNDPLYVDPSGGVDAGSRGAFELLTPRVNGKAKNIRRTERPGSQLYTVNLGKASS
jgi:hypothetical protein